jgi:hypothetical protein
VALPSALDSKTARNDLVKLRRTVRGVGDSDVTGWDPEAPALWLVTHGMMLLLIVDGSWQEDRASGDVVNEDDHSATLEFWLAEMWPRISGFSETIVIESTRNGESNEALLARFIGMPIIKDTVGAPWWGRWHQDRAKAMREDEITLDERVGSDWGHSTTYESTDEIEKEQVSDAVFDRLFRDLIEGTD